jgi:hypothetical protein
MNIDLEMAHNSSDAVEVCNEICGEIELLFNSVMSTVVDYFEEAVAE